MNLCPVITFKLYMSKLDPTSPFLWQKAKQGRLHYTDKTWFESRRVGKDLLNRYMKFLQKNVTLDGIYTNHSIRATVITRLDNDGFEARHIIQLSSHKNESTIKEYSVKCPENKRKAMFNSLSNAMQPRFKKIKPKPSPSSTVAKPPEPTPQTPDNQQNIPQLLDVKENLPSFELMPLGALDTIDDAVLADLLNDDFEFGDSTTGTKTDQNDPKQQQIVANPTINTQVNTINVPMPNMPNIPMMYFPNSSVTINYNFGK